MAGKIWTREGVVKVWCWGAMGRFKICYTSFVYGTFPACDAAESDGVRETSGLVWRNGEVKTVSKRVAQFNC